MPANVLTSTKLPPTHGCKVAEPAKLILSHYTHSLTKARKKHKRQPPLQDPATDLMPESREVVPTEAFQKNGVLTSRNGKILRCQNIPQI